MVARRGVWASLAVASLAAGLLTGVALPTAASARPACTAAQPGVSAATALAKVCGARVEVASARSVTAQTFANPDGSMTLEQSVEPRWARHADGSWGAIDATLHKAPDGTVVPTATVQRMAFSGGGTGPLATLTEDGRQLAVSWPHALPVPTLAGDTAVYAAVLPDVDLRVTASAKGFSEVLVVKTRAAAASPALKQVRFGLTTKGLTLAGTDAGGVEARDEKGRTVFAAPAPMLWDSAPGGDEPTAAPRSATAAATVPATHHRAVMSMRVSGNELSLTPDAGLLSDPGVQYPLYLDPSWTGGISGNAWTTVWSRSDLKNGSFWQNGTAMNDAANKGGAGSGRTCDSSDANGNCLSEQYVIRSLFRMDTSAVLGKQLFHATFRVQQRWSWTCNPKTDAKLWLTTGISPSTTWNNQPYWNPDLVAQSLADHRVGHAVSCNDVGDVEFDATAMVQNAIWSNSATMTVGLRAVDEGTVAQWKRFNAGTPVLAIDYDSAPNAPDTLTVDGKACGTGANRPIVATGSPTLRARLSDPDGDTLTGWFATAKLDPSTNQFVDVPGGGGSQGGVPSGSTGQFTPTGEVDGGVYNVRVVAADPWLSGPLVSNCEWQVDLTDPTAPTVNGDVYHAGSVGCPAPGCGGVGQTGSFTFTSSPDVASYRWGFTDPPSNIATPATVGAPVTVKWTPTSGGAMTLNVQAIDRSGRTALTRYQFVVAGLAPATARWLLNEPAGASTLSDDSGNGHTATLTAGAPGVPGRIAGGDTATHFSGTGFASAAHVLDTSRSYSVSAWVRLTDAGTTRTVVSQDGVHGASFRLKFQVECGCWIFELSDTDSVGEGQNTARSTDAATVNVWTHLIGVYDAGQAKLFLYVNGVLAGSSAAPPAPWNATGAFTIGRSRWRDTPTDFFIGDLAQVQAWNRVLMSEEIAAMTDPLSVGGVGEWHMDEVGPGPAFDASGRAHDLTFLGGASIPPSGSGQAGTGLHLNGSTAYAQADGPVLLTGQSFTVSAWVRLAATGGTGTQVVLSQDGTRTSAFQLAYRASDSRWLFGVAASDVDSPASAVAVSDAGAVAGQWTHLVGVYDAATKKVRLYLNGVAQFTVATATGAFDATGALAMGRGKQAGTFAGFLNGDVDEVRVFAGAVPDRSGPNLALRAPATASSSAPSAWGWDPSWVDNGPPSARMPGWSSWSSVDTLHTESIALTLPSQQTVSRVDLYARLDSGNVGTNFPANFTIEAWNGSAWVVVVRQSGYPAPATGEVQSFTFAPVTTNQIRVVGTSLQLMQFAEIELYAGVNRIP
jgi:hypothetical protein